MKNRRRSIAITVLVAFVLVLLGCRTPTMRVVDEIDSLGAESALVTMLRPTIWASDTRIALWDGEQFVGFSQSRTYIEWQESRNRLQIEVEAGKRYYIVVRPRPGGWTGGVIMDPVTRVDINQPGQREKIEKWFESMRPVAAIEENVARYVTANLPGVRKAIENFQAGTVTNFAILEAEDFVQ